MQESPIFSKTYDLLRWLIPLTIKFPRQQRFVLAQAIQQSAFALQASLFEAVRLPNKRQHLQSADVELDKLRSYLRLSQDLAYINLDQHKHASERLQEIGRLLGAWQKKV